VWRVRYIRSLAVWPPWKLPRGDRGWALKKTIPEPWDLVVFFSLFLFPYCIHSTSGTLAYVRVYVYIYYIYLRNVYRYRYILFYVNGRLREREKHRLITKVLHTKRGFNSMINVYVVVVDLLNWISPRTQYINATVTFPTLFLVFHVYCVYIYIYGS